MGADISDSDGDWETWEEMQREDGGDTGSVGSKMTEKDVFWQEKKRWWVSDQQGMLIKYTQ